MSRELESLSPSGLNAFIHHPGFSLQSLNEEMRRKPLGEQFCKDFFRSPEGYRANGVSLESYITHLSQSDLLALLRIAVNDESITVDSLCEKLTFEKAKTENALTSSGSVSSETVSKVGGKYDEFTDCLRGWDSLPSTKKAVLFSDFFGQNGFLKSYFIGEPVAVNLAYDAARGRIAEQWLATCCPEGVNPHEAMQNIMRFHSQVTMGLGTLVMDLFFCEWKDALQDHAVIFSSFDPDHHRFIELNYVAGAWHYTISDQLGIIGESRFAIARTVCDLLVTPNGFALNAMQYDHERLVAALNHPSVETQFALLLTLALDSPPSPAKGPLLHLLLKLVSQVMPDISLERQAELCALAIEAIVQSIPKINSVGEVSYLLKSVLTFTEESRLKLRLNRDAVFSYFERLTNGALTPVDANEACVVLGKLLRYFANDILFFNILNVLLDIAKQQQGIRFHPALTALSVALANQNEQHDFYQTFLEQLKQHTISAFRHTDVKTFLNEGNPLSFESGFKYLLDSILRAEIHEDVSEALCRTCVIYAKANQLSDADKEKADYHRGLSHDMVIFTAKHKVAGGDVPLFSVKTTEKIFYDMVKNLLPKTTSSTGSFFSKTPPLKDILSMPDKAVYVNQACYYVRKAQVKMLLPYVSLSDAAKMFLELGGMQTMLNFEDPDFGILKKAGDLDRLYEHVAHTISANASERERIVQLDATGLSSAEKMASLLKEALVHSDKPIMNALSNTNNSLSVVGIGTTRYEG